MVSSNRQKVPEMPRVGHETPSPTHFVFGTNTPVRPRGLVCGSGTVALRAPGLPDPGSHAALRGSVCHQPPLLTGSRQWSPVLISLSTAVLGGWRPCGNQRQPAPRSNLGLVPAGPSPAVTPELSGPWFPPM